MGTQHSRFVAAGFDVALHRLRNRSIFIHHAIAEREALRVCRALGCDGQEVVMDDATPRRDGNWEGLKYLL